MFSEKGLMRAPQGEHSRFPCCCLTRAIPWQRHAEPVAGRPGPWPPPWTQGIAPLQPWRADAVRRNGRIRVMRGGQQLHDGEIASLKIQRDDVREVRQGFECGIGLKNFSDFAVGDDLVCYTIERT